MKVKVSSALTSWNKNLRVIQNLNDLSQSAFQLIILKQPIEIKIK